MKHWRELGLFGAIGIVGLLVDTAVLYALKSTLGLFFARGISFLVAAIATWFLNKKITFRHKKSTLPKHQELVAYIGLMFIGGTANYTTYTWLVISYVYVQDNPFFGIAAGSLAGMLLNFFTSKFILFSKNKIDQPIKNAKSNKS